MSVIPPRRSLWVPLSSKRFCIWCATAVCSLLLLGVIFLLDTKHTALVTSGTPDNTVALPPFPLGVDPDSKSIAENPAVETYMNNFVASNHTAPRLGDSWFDRALAHLSEFDWYQNLATPATRILIIQSGERYEEIAENFAAILRWSTADKERFVAQLLEEVPKIHNGKLYPGRYVVPSDATPEYMAIAVAERFNAEVRTRYTDEISATLPLKDALIVASLIEREAYDFEDMRYISGVIWNRLFIDMKLQIDATLQYAKGAQSAAAGGAWWPVPRPSDKLLDSPYNTYQQAGLPPEPIANPSIDAIVAALNPRKTDCLFYFHTDDGTFYCNTTYEAHVAALKTHFGQGR